MPESHLLHRGDGHRRADPLVHSGNLLTTTCAYAYFFRLTSFQQPATGPDDYQPSCGYCVWSHQRADDILIPVQALCLCIQTGSAWWAPSAPSSRHVHRSAIESCPALQGPGCLGGPQTVDLSRDGRSVGRRDLQEPY